MTVLKRAQDLAQTFLTELQSGMMIGAFSNAGARFRLTSLAYDNVEEKYNTYQAEPSKREFG
eukprot:3110115-Prorocentrum_lima.AAC.1